MKEKNFLILSKRIISVKGLRCVEPSSFKIGEEVTYRLSLTWDNGNSMAIEYGHKDKHIFADDLLSIINIIHDIAYVSPVIFNDIEDQCSIMNDILERL